MFVKEVLMMKPGCLNCPLAEPPSPIEPIDSDVYGILELFRRRAAADTSGKTSKRPASASPILNMTGKGRD